MAICILVLDEEEKAYLFLEKLKVSNAQIADFQVIAPTLKEQNTLANAKKITNPKSVSINEVKLLSPKLSRKERQKQMSLWLMPFGFIAGVTFAGMTGLETFSNFGFGQVSETLAGGFLGMASGWIGSFFAARSVNTNQEDLKSILKFNKEGFWIVLLETPFEIEPPWLLINEISPIEVINLNLV